MDSLKTFKKRPALTIISTNNASSNLRYQSGPSTPSLCRSELPSGFSGDWSDFETTETLPADWLSDYPTNFRAAKISSKNKSQTCDIFSFSRTFFLNDTDESSRGSDSGLGNETNRTSFSIQNNIANGTDFSSAELLSNIGKQFSINSLDQSIDDGFSEERDSEGFVRSNTTSLDFSSPVRNRESYHIGRKCLSPFNLHRRRSSTSPNLCEAFKQNVFEKGSKRFFASDSFETDTENIALNTTPKRRKNSDINHSDKMFISELSYNGSHSSQWSDLPNLEVTPTNWKGEIKIKTNSGKHILSRSHSEIAPIPYAPMDEKKVDRVIDAVDNYSHNGFSSISHLLPTSDRQRFELTSIQTDDVARLLSNQTSKSEDLLLIDCRYPYEFNGGHVNTAVNIHTEEQILEKLFYPASNRTQIKESTCFCPKDSGNAVEFKSSQHSPLQCMKNHVNQSCILIFYCEFSSRRAPNLAKYLRSIDRKFNLYKYPYLFYPEVFIMSGGYHSFVQKFPQLCQPRGYVKMFDKRFACELGKYKRNTRKLRPEKSRLRRGPISPLHLEQIESQPVTTTSPPRAITWS